MRELSSSAFISFSTANSEVNTIGVEFKQGCHVIEITRLGGYDVINGDWNVIVLENIHCNNVCWEDQNSPGQAGLV